MPDLWPSIDLTVEADSPKAVLAEAKAELERMTKQALTLSIRSGVSGRSLQHDVDIYAVRIGYRYPLFFVACDLERPYPASIFTSLRDDRTKRSAANSDELREHLRSILADSQTVSVVRHLLSL